MFDFFNGAVDATYDVVGHDRHARLEISDACNVGRSEMLGSGARGTVAGCMYCIPHVFREVGLMSLGRTV